jgi:PAS domain S-box-containing protein
MASNYSSTPVKILLVEDENTTAHTITSFLEELGYRVAPVISRGEDAIASIDTLRPDCILMDIQLEGDLDGVETTEEIRRRYDIPVIYLTTSEEDRTFHRAKITEPYGYLVKPVDKGDLHKAIEICLYKHRLDQKLRDSEEKFRTLVQGIPDIVYRLDDQGRFVFVSENIRELGYEPDSLIGSHYSIILHPEEVEKVSRPLVLERYRNRLTGDEESPRLFDERRTGHRKTRNLRVRLLGGEQDSCSPPSFLSRVDSIGLFNRDITYREKKFVGTFGVISRIRLENQDDKQDGDDPEKDSILIASVSRSAEVVFKVDSQGRFRHVSDSIRQLGVEPESLVGKDFREVLGIDSLAGDSVSVETSPDEETQWGEVNSTGYYEDADAPANDRFGGTIGVIRDVSRRKQMEEKVVKIALEWEQTFNAIGDCISIHDRDFNILQGNRAFRERLNLDDDMFPLGFCHQVVHGTETPHPDCPLVESWKTAVPVTREFFEPHLDRYLEVTVSPVRDDTNEIAGFVHVMKDITPRKNAEKELKKALEDAEKANESKNLFMAQMSHDLRTPLNGIIGFTELLLDMEEDRDKKEMLENIRESGRTLLELISEIIDISRIESGALRLTSRSFRLKRFLEKVVSRYFLVAREKDIELLFHEIQEEEQTVSGDQVRIEQIITNIINNAIKFTDRGMVEVHTSAHLEGEERIILTVVVRDTGMGIPADTVERVFDRFYQVGEGQSLQGGAGLGLSIVQKLVYLMNGTIHLESRVGEGTTMTVTLPLEKASGHVEGDEAGAIIDESLASRPHRILVVEDEPVNRALLERVLTVGNWIVETASEGREALEKIEDGDYSLVITDINMPEMSGYDLTLHLRNREREEDRKRLPIVAFTAHAMEGDRQKCLELGMDGYLSKPISRRDLFALLESILGENRRKP